MTFKPGDRVYHSQWRTIGVVVSKDAENQYTVRYPVASAPSVVAGTDIVTHQMAMLLSRHRPPKSGRLR